VFVFWYCVCIIGYIWW